MRGTITRHRCSPLQAFFPEGAGLSKHERARIAGLPPPLSLASHRSRAPASEGILVVASGDVTNEHLEAAKSERLFWGLVEVRTLATRSSLACTGTLRCSVLRRDGSGHSLRFVLLWPSGGCAYRVQGTYSVPREGRAFDQGGVQLRALG